MGQMVDPLLKIHIFDPILYYLKQSLEPILLFLEDLKHLVNTMMSISG